MPKLNGLFDSFDNLDQITSADIARWLKSAPPATYLEKYLANKILYPQAMPISDQDMKIDLAILRQALRFNGPRLTKNNALLGDNPFLNITLRKIFIPEKFLQFAPDLLSLAWAFIDALLLDRRKEDWFQDLWTVVLTDEVDEIVGSVLLPQFKSDGGTIALTIQGKTYKISSGSLMTIPCIESHCQLEFKFNQGKILGKKEGVVEVYGGRLGLLIDGRIN